MGGFREGTARDSIRDVCIAARDTKNVRAVSFNFHTPYPDTKELALSKSEKAECCRVISEMMAVGAPVFNLKIVAEYTLLFRVLEKHFIITEGIGVELHPDNVTVPLLKMLKNAGVTKISIGIQSFQEKYQKILGRKAVSAEDLKKVLKEVTFETVSMDFIFALPGQTIHP